MPRSRSLCAIILLLAPIVLAGCLSNDATVDPSSTEPPAQDPTADWSQPLPAEITGLEKVVTTEGLESGYQLEVHGDIAYLAAWNAGFYTVDVSTPRDPQVLAHVPEHFGHDVDLLHYDDGSLYAAVAGSSEGIAIMNVTDPREPVIVSRILGQGSSLDTEGANVHNLRVVPGTHVIYNSRSVDTPGVDIVDASDPANPELVQVFGDLTCHDIAFWTEGDRAYCAGIRSTQIWDITSPMEPAVVTRIVNPAVNIHHWAKPARNGSLLMIGDEHLGATGPHAQACFGGAENPATGGTTTDPVGAVWFYDISIEAQPTPVSYVAANELNVDPEPCTAHFGEVVPGRDKLAIGFLQGGVYLIDFQDVTAPRVVDHLDMGDVPDLKVHNGWVFTAGRERGMDVGTFTGS